MGWLVDEFVVGNVVAVDCKLVSTMVVSKVGVPLMIHSL